MRVFVLGSGSTGNALLVEAAGTRLLVEAGVAPKVLASRLLELGVTLRPGELDGIVVSHHHGDHFGQAAALALAFGAPLFLHGGISAPSCAYEAYPVGVPLRVGRLTVDTTLVPHDATQVALRVDDGYCAFGIATDVGRVTPGLVALLADCDAALVEANHCTELLAFSEYPDVVKRRVSSGFGHLSNDQTAELAARLAGTRLSHLWLGHLSRSNNTEARALETVTRRARRIAVGALPSSRAVALDVHGIRPRQLGLPF